MSTPEQQLRIDRLTREALGNPDHERLEPRSITAFVLGVLLVACGITAAVGEHRPAPGPAAHRFVSVAPSDGAQDGNAMDLTY